jgi:molybdate transport system substrate-binding protein
MHPRSHVVPSGAVRKRDFLILAAAWTAAGWGRAQAPGARAPNPIRVAAASDLQFALAELAQAYQRQSGTAVQITLGASGNLAQQIRQGLPVDLFMSADEEFVFQLNSTGLTQDRGVIYALGRIALLVPAGSAIGLDPGLRGLREALPDLRHFAIANPEHAPYGRAARQALERTGLWPLVEPKLVIGENIAQATQFVTGGAAQAGITAASLANAPPVARASRSQILPADLHAPMRQRMALLRGASPAAADFYRFLQAGAARAELQRHGFGSE